MKQVTPITNTYLLVDTRERDPKLLNALKTWKAGKWERKTLTIGDYACSDSCCFWERKQADFTIGQMSSINRQLANMQAVGDNVYLVVNMEASEWLKPVKKWTCTKCKLGPNKGTHCIGCSAPNARYAQKMGFLGSLTARNLTPHWIPSHSAMLDWIMNTINKNHDSKYRGPGAYSPIRRTSHKDRGIHILLSLPGVGGKLARSILDHYASPGEFLRADPKTWKEVPGMGKKRIEMILDAFWKGGHNDD